MSRTPDPTKPTRGSRGEMLQLALEPGRQRDVVGVHARHVASSGLVEPTVQGRREAEALVVPQHAQPRVADGSRGCPASRPSSRRRRRGARGRRRSAAECSRARARGSARRSRRRRARRRAGRSAQASRSLRRVSRGLPSFDLVVATVGRVDELERLLGSLERQTHRGFTVLVVDQNDDDRLRPLLAAHPALDIAHLRSAPGLSRARNAALGAADGGLVAFPDDDCVISRRPARARRPALPRAPGARRADRPRRVPDRRARPRPGSPTRPSSTATTSGTAPSRSRSSCAGDRRARRPVRRAARPRIGRAVALGGGDRLPHPRGRGRGAASSTTRPWSCVTSVGPTTRETGFRDGASVGYLLRKHGYPPRAVARMLVRPIGGARRRSCGATATGRASTPRRSAAGSRGYRGARASKSSR